MSTLTGQYISQSYGGLIQLSTNTGIVTGSHTQLQDGFGTNLGVWLNGQGAISASAITSSADSRFNNVRVGNGSGGNATNTVVGEDALFSSAISTIGNTAIGYGTLAFNTSGSRNTALGWSALTSNTTGEYNTSLGAQSMLINTTGNNNVAVGYEALRSNTFASDNTAVGYGAGYNISTGTDNITIGYNAGRGITTGNNNTIVGANVTGLSSSLSNNIILATGDGSIKARYSGSWTLTDKVTITSGSDFNVHGNNQFHGAEFWSSTSQSGSAGVSGSITFDNTGVAFGVSVVSNSRLTVANSGVYNIQFSAQIETSAGADTMYVWFKKNGNNIPDSATKVVLANNTAQVMTVNILDQAATNDYYEIAYQTVNGNATVKAEAASGNIPAIPSVIATLTQVR